MSWASGKLLKFKFLILASHTIRGPLVYSRLDFSLGLRDEKIDLLKWDNVDFTWGAGTSLYRSCSMTFQNNHYVFGGDNIPLYQGSPEEESSTQISKLNGLKLERVGDLGFNFIDGACANVNDTMVYLCFPSNDLKQCRFTSQPEGFEELYQQISKSNDEHKKISIAASKCKLFELWQWPTVAKYWNYLPHFWNPLSRKKSISLYLTRYFAYFRFSTHPCSWFTWSSKANRHDWGSYQIRAFGYWFKQVVLGRTIPFCWVVKICIFFRK